jgi:hypothetical protein
MINSQFICELCLLRFEEQAELHIYQLFRAPDYESHS